MEHINALKTFRKNIIKLIRVWENTKTYDLHEKALRFFYKGRATHKARDQAWETTSTHYKHWETIKTL